MSNEAGRMRREIATLGRWRRAVERLQFAGFPIGVSVIVQPRDCDDGIDLRVRFDVRHHATGENSHVWHLDHVHEEMLSDIGDEAIMDVIVKTVEHGWMLWIREALHRDRR